MRCYADIHLKHKLFGPDDSQPPAIESEDLHKQVVRMIIEKEISEQSQEFKE